MREPEGIATPLPGRSSERAWSKHREPHFRNVEAVGSNPITSTKIPGQRLESGIPRFFIWFDVTLELQRIGAALGDHLSRQSMSLAVMSMAIAKASWAERWMLLRSVLRRS